ncbi:unnamed protein product [Rhodiola kirilowii]
MGEAELVIPRMAVDEDEELIISRRQLSIYLSTHMAYDLLPDSGKVVALDANLPVKQAFNILYEQGISVAPLWDFDAGHFIGIVTAMDFIMILKELQNWGSSMSPDEHETHTIAYWKKMKSQHIGTVDGIEKQSARPLVYAGPFDSLQDVCRKVLLNKIASVPILHFSVPDESFPQLLHLVSLTGILKCICRHFRHSPASLPIIKRPVGELQLGTWATKAEKITTLRPDDFLGAAMSLFIKAGVSAIPIVNGMGSLLNIYSRSDITAFAKDQVYAQIDPARMRISEALQLTEEVRQRKGPRCHTCLKSDSLHKVMEQLTNPGVRRLVVVEEGNNKVLGIISLSDIFHYLVG